MFAAVNTGRAGSDRKFATGLSRLARAGDLASAILLWPFHVYESRRILHAMGGMSDHELADIGLKRQDLGDASALPLASEVGGFLSARASERRRRW